MRSRNTKEAFRVAFSGLWYALRTQRNMRVHLGVAGIVTIMGLWLRLPADQWAMLVLTSGLVLVTEMTNTVIEKLVDLVCPDYHPAAKIVKDVMAGAVVLATIVAVGIGLLILGPPLWYKLTACL